MKIEFSPEFDKSLRRMIWFERTRWINPKQWYRETKWFIQRGRRGYSERDLWNLSDHIARSVIAFLDMPRMSIVGWDGTDKGEPKAKAIEAEIRWLMEQTLEGWDVEPEVVLSEAYQERMKRARIIFGNYWQALWD